MKKVFTIITLMLAFVVEAQSQTSLQIAELFNGSYKRKDNAIEVVVKGNQLKRYKLEVFRSLTIKNDPKDFERIEKLVEQDEKHAISKETGHIGERLYYAFYCFSPQKGRFRYARHGRNL